MDGMKMKISFEFTLDSMITRVNWIEAKDTHTKNNTTGKCNVSLFFKTTKCVHTSLLKFCKIKIKINVEAKDAFIGVQIVPSNCNFKLKILPPTAAHKR